MPLETIPDAAPLRPRSFAARAALWSGGAAWLAAVCAGFLALFRYDAEPGPGAAPPASWPARAPVALDGERCTLLLFAHPHCACTRATLTELDRLLARCQGRLRVCALFYTEPALGSQWERTANWERASAIPGVQVSADPDGASARLFGAATSGTVLVYAPDGQLRFHGGITSGRGHEGDSAGAASILSLVTSGSGAARSAEVFGCGLFAEGASR